MALTNHMCQKYVLRMKHGKRNKDVENREDWEVDPLKYPEEDKEIMGQLKPQCSLPETVSTFIG